MQLGVAFLGLFSRSFLRQRRRLLAVCVFFTLLTLLAYAYSVNSFQFDCFICHLWPVTSPCTRNKVISSFIVQPVIEFLNHSGAIATPLLLLDIDWLLCLHSKFQQCLQLQNKKEFLFGILQQNQFWLLQLEHLFKSRNWTALSYANSSVFRYSDLSVAVSVVENRSSYWYLHEALPVLTTARAFSIQGFEQLDACSLEIVSMPEPLQDYVDQWSASRFLDCNRTSAAHLRKTEPAMYSKKPAISNAAVADLAYLRDRLRQCSVSSVLFGGTLLGWYRECGIIPHTTDIDVAILASEYTPCIERTLRNDPRMSFYWFLGKPSDSLELSVYINGVKYDVFALYDAHNSSWVGGMMVSSRTKLRWSYPKLKQLCSAELLGELFYVPCNVVEFLHADYGATWYKVFHTANYVWYKSGSNVQTVGEWSEKEWPNVYQLNPKYQ